MTRRKMKNVIFLKVEFEVGFANSNSSIQGKEILKENRKVCL